MQVQPITTLLSDHLKNGALYSIFYEKNMEVEKYKTVLVKMILDKILQNLELTVYSFNAD